MDTHAFTWVMIILLRQAIPATSERKIFVNENLNTGKGSEDLVELSCSKGEWINVIDSHTSTCSGVYCTQDTISPYEINPLGEQCTGVQNCSENVVVPEDAVKIEVEYECLKVNCLNLCDIPVKPMSYEKTVDIHTPRFQNNNRGQCHVQCTVTGGIFTVTFYRFKVPKRDTFRVIVTTEDGVLTHMEPTRAYYRFPQRVNMLVVTCDNTEMDEHMIWFRVTDKSSTMKVNCHGLYSSTTNPVEDEPVTTLAQSTAQWRIQDSQKVDDDVFKSDGNETSSDTDDTESTLVGDLLGGLLALIVLVIIAVAVTILFCKKRKSTESSNKEESITQVTKPPNVPPRPSVSSPQRPVPDQCKADDYLTPVATSLTTAPLQGHDTLEPPVYLELENPGEYTDREVYDSIGEIKDQKYTTPYTTS